MHAIKPILTKIFPDLFNGSTPQTNPQLSPWWTTTDNHTSSIRGFDFRKFLGRSFGNSQSNSLENLEAAPTEEKAKSLGLAITSSHPSDELVGPHSPDSV